MSETRSGARLLIVALVLVFAGAWLASAVQTSGGDVAVRDIRFAGTDGTVMSALLYVPDGASNESPAPGVLAIHGYINSRETQSPYAIELARRGYVVLALDQTGHGYSDPPAFANAYGGPDGLTYLRSLGFVDNDRIVLEGHSMGGWASLIAAGVHPEDYASIVVSGSSTGTYGAPEGSAQWPRNLGLVYAQYDEFSQLMWGSPTGAGIVETDKLQNLFGTDSTVQPGRVYGDIDEGTARQLYAPAQTHPANHITASGVGAALDWVMKTVSAPQPIAADDQVWQWKELGTLISLAGMVLFVFPFGNLLLGAAPFRELSGIPAESRGLSGFGWWVGAAVFVLVPLLGYFPLQAMVNLLGGANFWLSQNVTTGIMFWAVGVGIVALVLFLLWHFLLNARHGATAAHYGVGFGDRVSPIGSIVTSLVFAGVVVAAASGLLALVDWLFLTDFRVWVVAVKLLDAQRFGIFLGYVIPFMAFFLVAGVLLHGQLRPAGREESVGRAMARNAVLMGLSIAIILVLQYGSLFSTGRMLLTEPDGGPALLTILAMQFVVLLPITGAISTYFFRKTGQVYPGAFINGMLITWIIVGGQATHYAF